MSERRELGGPRASAGENSPHENIRYRDCSTTTRASAGENSPHENIRYRDCSTTTSLASFRKGLVTGHRGFSVPPSTAGADSSFNPSSHAIQTLSFPFFDCFLKPFAVRSCRRRDSLFSQPSFAIAAFTCSV